MSDLRTAMLMSDIRKAVQQSVENREIYDQYGANWGTESINVLRAALAQTEPIISPEIKGNKTQPERKPLTQQELKVMWAEYAPNIGGIFEFARAIEAAHGIGEK